MCVYPRPSADKLSPSASKPNTPVPQTRPRLLLFAVIQDRSRKYTRLHHTGRQVRGPASARRPFIRARKHLTQALKQRAPPGPTFASISVHLRTEKNKAKRAKKTSTPSPGTSGRPLLFAVIQDRSREFTRPHHTGRQVRGPAGARRPFIRDREHLTQALKQRAPPSPTFASIRVHLRTQINEAERANKPVRPSPATPEAPRSYLRSFRTEA